MPRRQLNEADYIQWPSKKPCKNERVKKRKKIRFGRRRNNKNICLIYGWMVHDATAALAYATGNDSSFFALPTYARLVKLS